MARLVSNRLTAASVVIAGLVLAATAAASRVDLRTASPADQARATERSFFRADVVSDTASRRSGSATASIAALGASEATGFATAGEFAEAPANSWVTGTNRAVRSIYLRLRELTPAIAGHAYNGAEPGSTMSALAGQAAHVPPGTDLVTIQMGTNDACGTPDPTRPATFRAQFEAALNALEARVPRARVVVLSIFNLPAMWDAVKSVSAASFGRNLCIAATDRDKPRLARAVRNLNQQLASVCARHPNCRYDGGAAHRLRWRRRDVSTVDYFHPSLSGQRNIAAALWATGAFLPTNR